MQKPVHISSASRPPARDSLSSPASAQAAPSADIHHAARPGLARTNNETVLAVVVVVVGQRTVADARAADDANRGRRRGRE